MDRSYSVFKQFREKKYVHEKDLGYLVSHICRCLKLFNFGKSEECWCNMFAYYLKAKTVCEWKLKNGYLPVVKWGEAVCEDKIVDIFKEYKHCNCSGAYF